MYRLDADRNAQMILSSQNLFLTLGSVDFLPPRIGPMK